MTWISASDPLALLGIQAGQINTPTGNDSTIVYSTNELETDQRFINLGESVPIVFARFRNSAGGIMIAPGASEVQYLNFAWPIVTIPPGQYASVLTGYEEEIYVDYLLPISEGVVQAIEYRDVYQGSCRVGTYTQAYNARAGNWQPGNFMSSYVNVVDPSNPIDVLPPEAPFFCGSVGLYPNITTLSYSSPAYLRESERWKKQINVFIRGGMHVTRLYDNVYGPSDNFADLVKWLMVNTARVPSAMIDNDALTKAATFLEYNGFTCNCELKNSTNFADYIAKWAPYFLLGESNSGGKKGLRPLLPTTPAGAIDTSPVTPVYTFTEDTILPNTLEINYTSLSDRYPFTAQILWRQQIESDLAIPRTVELRYGTTSEQNPTELHDLSEFCTNENHAVKVGAYILARRTYPTHVIRFATRPQAHNTIVNVGDIIYVNLKRQATNYVASSHSYLYQVERVGKTLAGDVTYEAVHFPVNNQNRSLIALDVAAAIGTGVLFSFSEDDFESPCEDEASSTDTTVPPSVSIPPSSVNDPVIDGSQVIINRGTPNDINGDNGNPFGPGGDDGRDSSTPGGSPITGITGPNGTPQLGDTLGVSPCGNGAGCVTKWYGFDPDTGQQITPELGTGAFLSLVSSMVGKGIGAYTTCPDGNECRSPVTPPVVDLPYNRFNFVRAVYTATSPVATNSGVTPWFRINGGGSSDLAYLDHRTGPVHLLPANTGGPWSLGSLPVAYKVGGAGSGGYSNIIFETTKYLKDGITGYTGVLNVAVRADTVNYAEGAFLGSLTGSYEFSNDGVTVDYAWSGLEPE